MGQCGVPSRALCSAERVLSLDPETETPGGEDGAERERAYDRFVHANLKRNFIAHFAHGMLGMTGFRLIFAPTFVPAYLYMLTGSPFMVGLGQSLMQAGAVLSPVIGATQIEHRRLVMPVALTIGTLMRAQMLGLAVAGWVLTGMPLVVATLAFLFLLGFFTGSQRVAFQMLLAKVIPVARRGRLQALRNLVGGGIAAVLSLWAGTTLIDANVFGNGYATTFMVSFILTSAGLSILYWLLREPESPTVRQQMKVTERLREFPDLIADLDYRNFLIAQVLTTAGRIAMPFCIIYAGRQMEVDGATLGLLTLAFLGADTVTNLIWGTVGDKYGFRIILIVAVVLWLMSLCFIMAATTQWQFMLVFFGLGSALSAYLMSVTTLVLEFGNRDDIPMRLALSTTAETTMATIGPIIGGVIAAVFGLIPVFLISIAALGLALAVLLVAVKEPRFR